VAVPSTCAESLAATQWPGTLRRQQREALDALGSAWRDGGQRAWVVLPPGAGKTLVGLEAARRLGRKTVIFGPNTAIQAQWLSQWSEFAPATVAIGHDRELREPITALTYQSLAVFDPDAEVDEEGHDTIEQGARPRRASLIDRLHANGKALVEALHDAGPITLVLDEAHHLLEVWGALLAGLLDGLPDAHVIGLTATPPQTLSPEQAGLVDRLFGHPLYHASVAGLVRDGHLAPFAELAYLVTPTPTESDWLRGQAERFAELRTDLTDPGFATLGLFDWLDSRFVSRSTDHGSPISWSRLEKTQPGLARAAVRLHVAGLLALPDGARVREEHRRELSREDWVTLLDDYLRGFLYRSPHPRDKDAVEKIRVAVPSLGYRVTKHGIRAGRSPVDRVLARSEAKTHAAVEIVAWEATSLADRLRALVLCDHERATATLPARLTGVLDPQAGSARLMLENMAGDPRTAALNPVLVTGRTVAAPAATARDFAEWAAGAVDLDPVDADAPEVVEITGSWSSRTWVQLVTEYFESGRCQILIGTRGLLGEGWNAPTVNTLIDLTAATTATSVVQTRGRALRADPAWPGKVATNWSVVCVSDEHPGGAADWDRFVRKHTGFLAVDHSGEIVDGVAHVADEFSPYTPPPVQEFDAVNASMLERSANRVHIRDAWRVGEPYADRFRHELRIVTPGGRRHTFASVTAPPAYVPAVTGIERTTPVTKRRNRKTKPSHLVDVRAPGALLGAAVFLPPFIWALTATTLSLPAESGWLGIPAIYALSAGVVTAVTRRRRARAIAELLREAAANPADLGAIACAVADALKLAELSPVGSEAVSTSLDPDGVYRATLDGAPAAVTEMFASALDETLAPLTNPRYVIARYVVTSTSGMAVLRGRAEPNAVVYHAVPSVLGVNAKRARAFERAWASWVSSSTALYTGSPEGTGVLAAQRGDDPFSATTVMRLSWT
jgi:superfamily II DNA or RNA helicase